MKREWINVKDKLPEESGYVLVYYNNFCQVVSYSKKWNAFNHYDFLGKPDKYCFNGVIYWMALPELPNEATGSD